MCTTARTGRTRLVSVAVDGEAGNADSFSPALSGDGNTVVFASDASNLVAGDGNGAADIFLVNLVSGDVERISVSSAGTAGNGDSTAPAISLEGRYVAYVSAASNLVSGDSNGAADIFVFDRLTRHTARASVGVTGAWTGVQANGDSLGPPVADGRRASDRVRLAGDESDAGRGAGACAEVYALERADLPAYSVHGRVVDDKNRPVADVMVAAGPHRAVTDADGRYALKHVTGRHVYGCAEPGGDELRPRSAHRERRGEIRMDVDFQVAHEWRRPPVVSFAALRAASYSTSAFLQALRDSDEGGWVDAWFDHDAPDKSKNRAAAAVGWARARIPGFFNSVLGCFERRCYDGHDGTDFPYQDPESGDRGVRTACWSTLPRRALWRACTRLAIGGAMVQRRLWQRGGPGCMITATSPAMRTWLRSSRGEGRSRRTGGRRRCAGRVGQHGQQLRRSSAFRRAPG